MAELDQTARYALKMAPSEALAWLLPDLDPDLRFTRWLDTEMIAFPGEPNCRCDTVAELVSRSGQSPPWALVVEVEARPRPPILARVLEYLARLLRKLRHGPRRRDRYLVAGVVLFLRGRRQDLKLHMQLPGTDVGLSGTVRAICPALQQATAILERIGRGELGRSVLAWVPLMAGGGEGAVVQEWVRLASQETDGQRRSDYAGLALVFADSVGCRANWEQALEEFNMEQLGIVREWKESARREGRLEANRNDLLVVLRERFHTEVPDDLVQTVQRTSDLATLSQWLIAAVGASSLEAFRSVIQPPPASNP
jgi:hypothetical protein